MARGFLDALALFALPFALYTLALAVQWRYPFLRPNWSNGRLALLSVAGLGFVVLGLLFFGLLAPRHLGAYRPAHLEGGQLVPGHID